MTEISIAIQRGELPARTIRELVDAQRQNFAGAGMDLFTLRSLLERLERTTGRPEREGTARLPGRRSDWEAAWETLDRLEAHLTRANDKATLAFNAPQPKEEE